jgi:2-methylcitrate dehydratase PrpD
MPNPSTVSKETQAVAEYLSAATSQPLPDDVVTKTCYHLLDTVAAMLSGAVLEPGRLGIAYVRSQGGTEEAQVLGADLRTNATLAALANGISAHADETDDSHAPSFSHPGCAVVPAALAVAERHGRSGTELVRAVAAGYDIGCRVTPMLGMSQFSTHGSSLSSHAIVSLYGAAAAAAALEDLTPEQIRWVLSYTTQQCSGVTTWLRDERHVEKAFVFAGMGARNGVASATMVAAGMDGVSDVFSGHPNALDALSPEGDRSVLVDGLGERYEVMRTNIKKYAVGSPAQAAVQATEDLIERHGLTADQVERMEIHLPADLARIVDSRHMPDINCQYLVAGTLLDGRFSFEMAHDDERMNAPDVRSLIERMELLEDESTRGPRKGRVVVHPQDGQPLEAAVEAVRGTAQNPMEEQEVIDKCRDLLHPLVGEQRGDELIDLLLNPDKIEDVRHLRPLLGAPKEG